MDAVVNNAPAYLHVFFNISANVGVRCPNNPADVQLVQLGFNKLAKDPTANNTPEEVVTYSAVRPGDPYASGNPDDPLSRAIALYEKVARIPADPAVPPRAIVPLSATTAMALPARSLYCLI